MRKFFCWKKDLPAVLAGALLILFAALELTYQVPVTAGTDQNGYHVAARCWNLTGRFCQIPPDEFAFVGHMWVANERGEYYAKYPPLYPMIAGWMNDLSGPGDG